MSDLKNYFRNLFRNHENITLKQTLVDLLECKNKVVRDLRTGRIDVNEQQTDLDDIINLQRAIQPQIQTKSKRLLMQQQISSLNREQFEDDEAFKKAKQQIIKQRQEQIRQEKQQRENKRREMEEKVKKWTQEQKQLSKKKQMKQADEQRMRKIDEQLSKIKIQRDKAALIAEKRKQIEQNLKNIQDNRIRRQQMMINLRSQSQDKIPLYVEYEKRAKQFEDELKFEQNILKKNNKISKKVDYQQLKNHERMFLTKIQQRNRKFQQSRARASSSMPSQQFNIYVSRSEEKVRQDLEKKNKRWKYQEKIKQIPIEIDESKRVKIEIALDKAKNPFKYNFLSQKKLNQFQIFGEFKNFSLNNDPKQLGNSYFEEAKKLTKQSRIQKSNSVGFLKQASMSQRPQYRNYLAEMQQRRPQRKNDQQEKDQFKKMTKNYKNKDIAFKELQKKTEQLDSNFLSKVKELKKIDNKKMESVLNKKSQIDQTYTKALKAKLACLEMVN